MSNKYKSPKGYVALLSTLIIMIVLIVFLTTAQEITTGGLEGTLNDRLGNEATFVAYSCLEDTLLLLRTDSSYAGDQLNIADGFCTIEVSGASSVKNIEIEASTLNSYFRTVSATVDIIELNGTKQVALQNVTVN